MGLVQTFCYPCYRLAVKEKVSKLIPNGPPLLDNAAHNNMINERIGIKYIKIISFKRGTILKNTR